MGWTTLLGIAIGLAMDAFAVSIAVGARLDRLTFRPVFRLCFHFGLFQFLMPIVGWVLGLQVSHRIGHFGHWVAFVLLAGIGGKMIYESVRPPDDKLTSDPTRKWSLLMLSLATSMDALAVGFSIALLDVSIISACIVIGLVASALTLVGMYFGPPAQSALRLDCGHLRRNRPVGNRSENPDRESVSLTELLLVCA